MNKTWIKKSISASGNVLDEENVIREVDVSSYGWQLKLLDGGVGIFYFFLNLFFLNSENLAVSLLAHLWGLGFEPAVCLYSKPNCLFLFHEAQKKTFPHPWETFQTCHNVRLLFCANLWEWLLWLCQMFFLRALMERSNKEDGQFFA